MIVCDYFVFVSILGNSATGERWGPVLRPACLRAREPRSGGCPLVGMRSVWRSGGGLGCAERPKRPPKRPKTRQDGFFEPTWAHVGANMEPCWHQNRIPKVSYAKTASKLKMIIFPI